MIACYATLVHLHGKALNKQFPMSTHEFTHSCLTLQWPSNMARRNQTFQTALLKGSKTRSPSFITPGSHFPPPSIHSRGFTPWYYAEAQWHDGIITTRLPAEHFHLQRQNKSGKNSFYLLRDSKSFLNNFWTYASTGITLHVLLATLFKVYPHISTASLHITSLLNPTLTQSAHKKRDQGTHASWHQAFHYTSLCSAKTQLSHCLFCPLCLHLGFPTATYFAHQLLNKKCCYKLIQGCDTMPGRNKNTGSTEGIISKLLAWYLWLVFDDPRFI